MQMSLPSHRASLTRKATARAAITSNRSPEVTRSEQSRTNRYRIHLWNTPVKIRNVWSQISLKSHSYQCHRPSVEEMAMRREGFMHRKSFNLVAIRARNHPQNLNDLGAGPRFVPGSQIFVHSLPPLGVTASASSPLLFKTPNQMRYLDG